MDKKTFALIGVFILLLVTGSFFILRNMSNKIEQSIAELEQDAAQAEQTTEPKTDYSSLPKVQHKKALQLDSQTTVLVEKLETTKQFLIEGFEQNGEAYISTEEVSEEISSLKRSIIDFHWYIESNFADHAIDLELYLSVNGGTLGDKTIPWEEYYFHHAPLAAVITILTKYQSEARYVQSQLLDALLEEMDNGKNDNQPS